MCLLPCHSIVCPCLTLCKIFNVKRLTTCCGLPLRLGVHLMCFLFFVLDVTLLVLFSIWATNLPVHELKRNWASEANTTGATPVMTHVRREISYLVSTEYPLTVTMAIMYAVWVLLDVVAIIGFALGTGATLTAWGFLTVFRFLHCPMDVFLVAFICALDHNHCLQIVYPDFISLSAIVILPLARSVMVSYAPEVKEAVKTNGAGVESVSTQAKPCSPGNSLPSGVVRGFSSDSEFDTPGKSLPHSIIISYPFDVATELPMQSIFEKYNTSSALARLHSEREIYVQSASTSCYPDFCERRDMPYKTNISCGVGSASVDWLQCPANSRVHDVTTSPGIVRYTSGSSQSHVSKRDIVHSESQEHDLFRSKVSACFGSLINAKYEEESADFTERPPCLASKTRAADCFDRLSQTSSNRVTDLLRHRSRYPTENQMTDTPRFSSTDTQTCFAEKISNTSKRSQKTNTIESVTHDSPITVFGPGQQKYAAPRKVIRPRRRQFNKVTDDSSKQGPTYFSAAPLENDRARLSNRRRTKKKVQIKTTQSPTDKS